MLVQQGHAKSGPTRYGPLRRLHFTGDDTKEGGLAGAIAPDNAPTLALANRKGDVLKYGIGAVIDAQV